jgi:hypothetical protein
MSHLVKPMLEQGLFASVHIDPNRLFSQVLDNMNKSAVVGFPFYEIGQRLMDAAGEDIEKMNIYRDVQVCATRFRQFCLDHNLLDFSLQVEIFIKYLWHTDLCRSYLQRQYSHLIVDNLEEDTPIAHDLIADWLPDFGSCLLIYDQGGGYRRFLGADPSSGYRVRERCNQLYLFEHNFVQNPAMTKLKDQLTTLIQPGQTEQYLIGQGKKAVKNGNTDDYSLVALTYEYHRFYPQMLDWVAEQIVEQIQNEGVPAEEIVVLAPYFSDALRFSISNRLEMNGVPSRSHRPSRSLREEPATHCLLTLAKLAYPSWGIHPTRFDVAYAFVQAIQDLDLVRAQLLADIVFRTHDGIPSLTSFDLIKTDVQERITYRIGERYEQLRVWLSQHTESGEVFDHFLGRIFGEVLSQPGFGFHSSIQAAEVAANLIESSRKFRWVAGSVLEDEGVPIGREYLQVVQEGVLAAQYTRSWQVAKEGSVLLAPAYTYLMSNRPASVQFWLDIGSRGWSERVNQPLTHPYVLSRNWPKGKIWTDMDELRTSQESLLHLIEGLLSRCRYKVYLGLSELDEHGYEDRGPLLQVFYRFLQLHAARQPRSGVA